MKAIYKPDTQQTAKYAIPPFVRFELLLNSRGQTTDRSEGELFPQIEGEGFFIERADFPVLLSPVNPTTRVEQTVAARDGLEYSGAFKGLSITHPTLNTEARLSLVLSKSPTHKFANQSSDPVCRFGVAYALSVNTATDQSYLIYVPPGLRLLRRLQVVLPAATITSAIAQQFDKQGGIITAPSTIVASYNGLPVAFTQASQMTVRPRVTILGANAILDFDSIVLTTSAQVLNVLLTGTGLAQALSIYGEWA